MDWKTSLGNTVLDAQKALGGPELSIIVPMYNEEDGAAEFFNTVVPILEDVAPNYEIICVNDGSRDATLQALRRARETNPRVKILGLSRNFGKEAAMSAGLDMASGRAVIPMDADLQDPPELIRDMVDAWKKGAQVVLARRSDRGTDGFFKRLTASLFYRLSRKITNPPLPENVGDFRLMDRVVVDALKQLPERTRFMKGLFAWVGFRQVTIDYVRPERHAGTTKFNFRKLWNFALDGIFSFSAMPLKVWSYVGVFVSLTAIVFMIGIMAQTLIFGISAPGYASLMSVLLFFNGMILMSLGALGEYVGRIFMEVKQRPLYVLNEVEGFEVVARAKPDTTTSKTEAVA